MLDTIKSVFQGPTPEQSLRKEFKELEMELVSVQKQLLFNYQMQCYIQERMRQISVQTGAKYTVQPSTVVANVQSDVTLQAIRQEALPK